MSKFSTFSELWHRERNRALRITRAFGAGTASRIRQILTAVAEMEKDPEKKVKLPRPTRTMKRICPSLYRGAERRKPMKFVEAEITERLTDSRGRDYARLSNGQIVHAFAFSPEDLAPAELKPWPAAIRHTSVKLADIPANLFPRSP